MKGIKIIGTGHAVPQKVVTNDDMAKIVDTSDDWIRERTGIRERRFITGSESTTSMAVEAGRKALENAGVAPEQIGACVVATITQDTLSPSTGNRVAKALSLPEDIPSFDLNAACTGFVYALRVAQGLIGDTPGKPYALVIGTEALSRKSDMTDRTTCVIFADGAGAAVVGPSDTKTYSFLGAKCDEAIGVPGDSNRDAYITMDGRRVFRFATRIIPRIVNELLTRSGKSLADIDQFVFHQANRRIVDHAVKKIGIDPAKCYQNIDRYGNTSGASIPLALDEIARNGQLKPDDTLLLAGFGAGLTYGGMILSYAGRLAKKGE